MVIESSVPTVIEDNAFELIDIIKACIWFSDPDCFVKIDLYEKKLTVHITPSRAEFRQSIVDNLVTLNRLLHIKIVFSSSLKISKKVSFSLQL